MEKNFEDEARAIAVKLDLFVYFRFTVKSSGTSRDALNNTNACRILDGIRANDVAWHYENTGPGRSKGARCAVVSETRIILETVSSWVKFHITTNYSVEDFMPRAELTVMFMLIFTYLMQTTWKIWRSSLLITLFCLFIILILRQRILGKIINSRRGEKLLLTNDTFQS